MKSLIAGMVVGLLLVGLGCSGGMTEEQVVGLIRERDAEVEKLTEQVVETIKGNMSESEARMQQQGEDLVALLVETVAVESAADIVELREYVDREVNTMEGQMVDGFLTQRQYITDQILTVDKFMTDAEASIREFVRAEGDANYDKVRYLADDTLATIRHDTDTIVRALCEADYWANTALSMTNALGNHLEGDGTSLEEVELFLYGIVIGDNYGDISTVCRVDADDRWVLIKQLDKILPDRRE